MIEMIIGSGISVLTGISGFYWGLRKNKVEVENSTLQNIHTHITIYEKIIDDLRDEIIILVQKIDEQRTKIIELENKLEDIYKKTKTL